MMLLTTIVSLIACHGGAADHFATFAQELMKEGYEVQIHASGPGLKKFQERGIENIDAFDIDGISFDEREKLAKQIALKCKDHSIVITDVGHQFDVQLQEALKKEVHAVRRLAYYDNPENFVPGGYSATAAKVMLLAEAVLFSNSHLATSTLYSDVNSEIDLSGLEKIGLGFYPISNVIKVKERRLNEHDLYRDQLFKKLKLVDLGQKVLVYFGGNNEVYFSNAFPAFLSMLSEIDLSNVILVLQQHPGAIALNRDKNQIQNLKIFTSDFSSEEAQLFADGALYYQTSMGPQFILAGIPTLQVGHDTYEDILVKNHLIKSATNSRQLQQYLNQMSNLSFDNEIVYKGLGIKQDWFDILKSSLKN